MVLLGWAHNFGKHVVWLSGLRRGEGRGGRWVGGWVVGGWRSGQVKMGPKARRPGPQALDRFLGELDLETWNQAPPRRMGQLFQAWSEA